MGDALGVQHDLPSMGRGAMFPQIDPLPSPQKHRAIAERNTQLHRSEGTANMSWHVIGPFHGVGVEGIPIGTKSRKKSLQIDPHIRIGIFLDL